MTFKVSRRAFVAGGASLAAGGLLAGSRAWAQDAPRLTPAPDPADLAGGPDWTPPDLGGQTLRMWGLNYAPHVEHYNYLIDRFGELTGATINLEPQDDILNTSLTALASGNPPDLFCLMGRMSDALVRAGGLLDVTDAVFGDLGIDNDAWFFPDPLQAYTFGGRIYGVPVEGNAHAGVSVRLDLIEAAGSAVDGLWPGAVPESEWASGAGIGFNDYDQMYNLAAALAQEGDDGARIWGQNRQGWELLCIASLMWQQGVFWFDEESNEFSFDSDAGVEALEYIVTRPYELGIESKLAVGNTVNAFVAGQTALSVGNDAAAGEGEKVGFPATNLVQPSIIPGETPLFVGEGGWGFEIPVGARNEAAAIEFLKFMTTYEAQFTWSQIYGGHTPACRALVNSEIYQGDSSLKVGQRRLLTAGPNTRFMGHGWDPQIYPMVGTIVDVMREGRMTARETAAELQQQIGAQQQRYLRG